MGEIREVAKAMGRTKRRLGESWKLELLVLRPRPVRILLAPKLMEKIRSLLAPLGLRLEEEGRFIFVAGKRKDEARMVATSLSAVLSGEVEGKGEGSVVLEDADLSRVERELAKIRQLRRQRSLWKRAGLPEPLEAAVRGWFALERKARLIEAVPLGKDRLREVLEEARVLYARILAREICNT